VAPGPSPLGTTRPDAQHGHVAESTRKIPLPDGRTMTVRPVKEDDLAGLRHLYGGLSIDDLHTRFFSAYHPSETFLNGLTHAEADGGFRLVAVVDDELVGEIGYAPLANGDAEFGIAIAAEWRGWLGPYLLDALVAEARDRGVPNLEAEILLENRRMLALVRHRGYATLDHDGWTSARVLIGAAAGRVPTWPRSHAQPRVLVEVPGGRWHAEGSVRAAGLEVIACPGPQGQPPDHCPVLRGEQCPLAAGADAIVYALNADDPRGDAIVAGHRRLHPDVPVCKDPRGDAKGVLDVLRQVLTDKAAE
jgi:GNAT superfamily N-acetyltransferase